MDQQWSVIPVVPKRRVRESASSSHDCARLGTRRHVPLGEKATLLQRLARRGVSVPASVSIMLSDGLTANSSTMRQTASRAIGEGISVLEELTGKHTGGRVDPLLIAVRLAAVGGTHAPALLGLGSHPGDSADRCAVAAAEWLARHLESRMIRYQRNEQPPNETLEVVLQEMCPSMMLPSDARVWVSARLGVSMAIELEGHVHERSAEGELCLMTFDDWTFRTPSNTVAEVVRIFSEVSVATGRPCHLCVGISSGRAYLLSAHQQRNEPWLAPTVLVRQVADGTRTHEEAVQMADPRWISGAARQVVAHDAALTVLHKSTGDGEARAASGRLALSAAAVKEYRKAGEPVILARERLMPSDAPSIAASAGVVTARGGPASHLVLVARGLGKATLAGINGMTFTADGQRMVINSREVQEGDWVTVDESAGSLLQGKAEIRDVIAIAARQISEWATQWRRARVYANADHAEAAALAFAEGADGIGMCRSENQLVSAGLALSPLWLLAPISDELRHGMQKPVEHTLRRELHKLLEVADGRAVHYRLLDPPIADVLPETPDEAASLASRLNLPLEHVAQWIAGLRDTGTAMGFRGCRWGILSRFYPTQIRLAVQTAVATGSAGRAVDLVVVVPAVVAISEMAWVRRLWDAALADECAASQAKVTLRLGCMVETPRAASLTHHLARMVDVLCYGTNDFTQATWALHRDDPAGIVAAYLTNGLLQANPFEVLDAQSVVPALTKSIHAARTSSPKVAIVVCGEHASDPSNANAIVGAGATALSCRALSVPAMNVALAQAEMALQPRARRLAWPLRPSSAQKSASDAYCCVVRALANAQRTDAQLHAIDWASSVASSLELPEPLNWKFFKRDLATRWFGRLERKRFEPPWDAEAVLGYALEHAGKQTMRYSLFPREIASHAVSEILPNDAPPEEWLSILQSLDMNVALEMFPQQPTDRLCLRAVLQLDRITLEAGIGQAMYVFEEERGDHHTVCLSTDRQGKSQSHDRRLRGREDAVARSLERVLSVHGPYLAARMLDMCEEIGVDWLAVEAYSDASIPSVPVVCDLDLPHDIAFQGP